MKKEEVKNKRTTEEAVEPWGEMEIAKEVQEDGSVLYFHPISDSKPEPVYMTDLFSYLLETINKFENLINHLTDEEFESFGSLGQIILQDAQSRYWELSHFLEKAVGNIHVDVMGRNGWPYRPGRVLAVKVTPCKAEEA